VHAPFLIESKSCQPAALEAKMMKYWPATSVENYFTGQRMCKDLILIAGLKHFGVIFGKLCCLFAHLGRQ